MVRRRLQPAAKTVYWPPHALYFGNPCGCCLPCHAWMCTGNGQAAARQRAEPARKLTGVVLRAFCISCLRLVGGARTGANLLCQVRTNKQPTPFNASALAMLRMVREHDRPLRNAAWGGRRSSTRRQATPQVGHAGPLCTKMTM